jgi:hypothetical protein
MGVGFSPELKRPERDANHSTSSSVEVRNAWSHSSIPEHVLTAWCLIKQWISHRESLPYLNNKETENKLATYYVSLTDATP